MSDNIKVVVKVRPLIPREIEDKLSYQWRVKNNTLYQLDQSGRDIGQGFTFDKVYDKDTKTTNVYNDIAKPIVEAAMAGFNGTIFAYGQTSSGKTYTMSGTEDSVGIVQLAVVDLFKNIKNIPGRDFLVRVSYIEIYNETVRDLLDLKKHNLKVHESFHGVKVDATEKVTSSPEELFEFMSEGDANRRVGATNMNEESSRSHSIFQITIESREHIEGEEQAGCVNVSQLNLVDLAGSERSGQTGATGVRFKEGTHINKSLSSLALVIKQLSEDPNKFINYRDSKLTRILQNSLGGNAKTSIICAITPAAVEETISTLQFANRAKSIKNKPEVNAVATDATMIQSLTKQLSKLQSELANKKNLEQDNYNLSQKIARLQRYILNGISATSTGDANRRKTWCAPRRTTICAEPSHEFVAPKPKFRTPVLKYNPLTTSVPLDFKPIQNDKLASVPEETVPGHVTPTQQRKVNFNDEVIELDSDDSNGSIDEVVLCSPYHKCYGASKTPPCVLRKNAIQAEKNFQDIVELTAREKIYTPEVTEMIKKLEENVSVISRLEEEVNQLNCKCEDKDSEIYQLKNKINSTEEEVQKIMNSKSELEALCNEYHIKLTDLEVSYDTVKKKAKTREDELLTLLSEQKPLTKENEFNIGNTLSRTFDKGTSQFMDISGDISLVNSDNEVHSSRPISDKFSAHIEELNAQLIIKKQIIAQLESELAIQNENNLAMENSNQNLQRTLATFEEKALNAENEIALLKSLIENLNTTVKGLQENLKSANDDLNTYNNFILCLKNQLVKKGVEDITKFDDSILNIIAANEENIIANNENMNNIIKSFKITLLDHFNEIKTKEIDYTLLEDKEKQIQTLNEEIENLNTHLKDNIDTIRKLMSDTTSFKDLEKQFSKDITDKENQNIELKKKLEEICKKIESLEENNAKLAIELAEKERLHLGVTSLDSVNKETIVSFETLDKNKELAMKLQEILKILSEQEVSILEVLDNDTFLSDILLSLKDLSTAVMLEKSNADQNICALLDELSSLQMQVKTLREFETKLTQEIKTLSIGRSQLVNDVETLSDELSKKNQIIIELQKKFNCINDSNEKNETLKQNEFHMFTEIERLKLEISETSDNFNKDIQDLQSSLASKNEIITLFEQKMQSQEREIVELKDMIDVKDKTLKQNESQFYADIEKLKREITDKSDNFNKEIQDLQLSLKSKNEIITLNEQRLHSQETEIIKLKDIIDVKDETLKQNESHMYTEIERLKREIRETSDNLNKDIQDLQSSLKAKNEIITLYEQRLQSQEKEIIELKDMIDVKDKTLKQNESQMHTEIERLKQEISETTENFNTGIQDLQSSLKSKSEIITLNEQKRLSLEREIIELKEIIDLKQDELLNFKDEVIPKLQEYENLNKQFEKAHTSFKETQILYEEALKDEDTKLTETGILIQEMETLLEQKNNAILNYEKQKQDILKAQNQALENIFNKLNDCKFNEEDNYLEFEGNDLYTNIILLLDSFFFKKSKINMANSIEQDSAVMKVNEELEIVKQDNRKLLYDLSELETLNSNLASQLQEMKTTNKMLSISLLEVNNSLSESGKELKEKTHILNEMETNLIKLKSQIMDTDNNMKKILEIKEENDILQKRIKELEKNNTYMPMPLINSSEFSDYERNNTQKPLLHFAHNNSPKSLLTLCCNKIVDTIQPDENDLKSVTSSSSEPDINNSHIVSKCNCKTLENELQIMQQKNINLTKMLEQSQSRTQNLLKEQAEIKQEIQLLLEPANDLRKKINNHRTHLYTLTATTYAENKLLNSKLKVLQHHHNRFHNVSQRDIPAIQSQLMELMTIIKSEPSLIEQQNYIKRFSLPDVLDKTSVISNIRNESTLDADLLMLDTNITLTTVDSTILGHDQTCFEMNNVYLDNEVACQTCDEDAITKKNQFEQLETLQEENAKLREQIDKLSLTQLDNIHLKVSELKDAQISPMKLRNETDTGCSPIKINSNTDAASSPIKLSVERTTNTSINESFLKYETCNCKDLLCQENLKEEISLLSQKLSETIAQKKAVEEKYNNLNLEMPATQTLVRKLNILQKDFDDKVQEQEKLKSTLNNKNVQLKQLQEENDSLSTQVMETISESDDLRKELDSLKELNEQLSTKKQLDLLNTKNKDKSNTNDYCTQCTAKDEKRKSIMDPHSKLNRSHSDSDSSARYNKISTLQSELDAGRENCEKLYEEVATIKNHLERSNISIAMDLDESIGENIFSFTRNFDHLDSHSKQLNVAKIPEEHSLDLYNHDKIECFNYYIEKTGSQKENLNRDDKIITIMKMLYDNLISQHGNEVENLRNRLTDVDESKYRLQTQIDEVTLKHTEMTKELENKNQYISQVTDTLSKLKKNLDSIKETDFNNVDNNSRQITVFKDNLLRVLDSELQLSFVSIFESLIDNILNKHQSNLNAIMDQYNKLQQNMEITTNELAIVNDNLAHMKSQMLDRENEYNLLKAQKEKIQEISNAVTLDIIMKEKELSDTITKSCQRLVDFSIVPSDIDLSLPPNKNVDILITRLIDQYREQNNPSVEKEKESLIIENLKLKSKIQEKQKKLEIMKEQRDKIEEISTNAAIDLAAKENELQSQKSLHKDLKDIYDRKVEENNTNISIIEKSSQEISLLKDIVEKSEATIQSLENALKLQTDTVIEKESGLIEKIKELQYETEHLKSVNQMIMEQKGIFENELEKARDTIKRNNIELDKMTSDVLILQESVKENSSVIETLKVEGKALLNENQETKTQLEEKIRECSRLQMNIKTHEKTAQIQSGIIIRLKNQKVEDDKSIIEKDSRLQELSQQCSTLQKHNEEVKNNLEILTAEITNLKSLKEDLETRVSELKLELEANKCRSSLEASNNVRRRRQSLYDSKRLCSESKDCDDENKVEAVFSSRGKPDDLFMDAEDGSSNRSTPCRLSRGRESLLSRQDQSDKDEDSGSRPGSVLATRRRRQSTHDLHRSVMRTPEPNQLSPNKLKEELNGLKADNSASSGDNEVTQLKERLSSCMQELEELKERFREVDEECEICSQYLQERDEQCARLKKEKTALEKQLADLTKQLQDGPKVNQSDAEYKQKVDAAVNTDEDWANLHSVVVDRMSFDAEVEKNKKLTKAIEEFRFKNRDLKATIAKMQKALEKRENDNHVQIAREYESLKKELKACQMEVDELRKRCAELDEECEICGEYLREKDDQIQRLKEAKTALEMKLVDRSESPVGETSRRRRQSVHDQLRNSGVRLRDVGTDTYDDFLSNQVERDENTRPGNVEAKSSELQRLKKALEQLNQQKAELEQQLSKAPTSIYVSTGSAIVQNQQLSDVMRENHKLKKHNAKLIKLCMKRGKSLGLSRENENESELG